MLVLSRRIGERFESRLQGVESRTKHPDEDPA